MGAQNTLVEELSGDVIKDVNVETNLNVKRGRDPWLIHVDIWQKPQYCKVISLQLKLIKKKKRKREVGKKKIGEFSGSPVLGL